MRSRYGFAARCEAVAVPRRSAFTLPQGCAPGSGFAPSSCDSDHFLANQGLAISKWHLLLTNCGRLNPELLLVCCANDVVQE